MLSHFGKIRPMFFAANLFGEFLSAMPRVSAGTEHGATTCERRFTFVLPFPLFDTFRGALSSHGVHSAQVRFSSNSNRSFAPSQEEVLDHWRTHYFSVNFCHF